jgi:hypothetical protein
MRTVVVNSRNSIALLFSNSGSGSAAAVYLTALIAYNKELLVQQLVLRGCSNAVSQHCRPLR